MNSNISNIGSSASRPLRPSHAGTMHPRTWVIASGRRLEPGEPLNAPIVPASNFVLGAHRAYSRDDGTPTWEALEEVMGGLEGGQAVAFSSGMGAISAVFDQLGVGARVVIPTDCYPGVVALTERGVKQRGWQLTRIPAAATEVWVSNAAIADLLWLESPTNPLLHVSDVPAICAAPRKSGTLVAVDNTLATPLNQRPLACGADLVVHSVTKYIGGHSDLLGGVVVAGREDLFRQMVAAREVGGATPGALEAFLAARGARTLALRLEASQANAIEIARRLERARGVERVRYPGLASDPHHELAARTLKGFGALISFDVAGGAAVADRVCQTVKLVRHATSLGAVESTMERRAAVPGQDHLPPGLLRLSVGCEHVEDIWKDLEQTIGVSSLR